MGGEGWTHGEELLLRADEGIDFNLVFWGSFGRGLEEAIEDGAADLACCSEDGVGWHVELDCTPAMVRFVVLEGSRCSFDRWLPYVVMMVARTLCG
jgi:hypothetical protein